MKPRTAQYENLNENSFQIEIKIPKRNQFKSKKKEKRVVLKNYIFPFFRIKVRFAMEIAFPCITYITMASIIQHGIENDAHQNERGEEFPLSLLTYTQQYLTIDSRASI